MRSSTYLERLEKKYRIKEGLAPDVVVTECNWVRQVGTLLFNEQKVAALLIKLFEYADHCRLTALDYLLHASPRRKPNPASFSVGATSRSTFKVADCNATVRYSILWPSYVLASA